MSLAGSLPETLPEMQWEVAPNAQRRDPLPQLEVVRWGPPPLATPRRNEALIVNWYGIIVTSLLVSFGTWKAMASYRGWAVTSNVLDWSMGVVLSLMCAILSLTS